MTDRFIIAPYDEKSGLTTNVEPWLIPDSAYSSLYNAYVFRGRVRKRFGSQWMGATQLQSRLAIELTNDTPLLFPTQTDGSGNLSGNVSALTPSITYYAVGQGFSIGALPYSGALYGVISNTGGAQPMAQTVTTTTATYNISNGDFVFAGAPINSNVWFYSHVPVITDGVTGIASGTVPGSFFEVGQMFSVGTDIFTVITDGANEPMLSTNPLSSGTYSTTDGAFTITSVFLATPVIFYPATPVMGLLSYQTNLINDEPVIAFDTQFAYQFTAGSWSRLDLEVFPGDSVWSGTDLDFFWGATWFGSDAATKVFFVTNNNPNETNYIRAYNATLANGWQQFKPAIDNSNYLISALIVIPFKNRLLFLNTWEGPTKPGTNYQNRCRYSQIGSPFDANAYNQTIAGKGNAIDASTSEAIISCEFVKDRLIVFFEKSTWELVYTGNQSYPFTWQQINTELGCESSFSVIPFDKICIGVGNVGIHACNGANVDRIDQKIPSEIFNLHASSDGPFRVYGIRDYVVEQIYWTFPNQNANPYPNQVLVFDYVKGTWALNNDSITCFGYYYPQNGVLWSSNNVYWSDPISWGGNQAAQSRNIIAGNQQGYVFIVNPDITTNASVLQITDLLYSGGFIVFNCINHNLQVGDYIMFTGIVDTGNLGTSLNGLIFSVVIVSDVDTFSISYYTDILNGTYLGNGTMARVSNINITTKEYNFYVDKARNAYVSKVDFQVDATAAGSIQVDFLVSTNVESMTESGTDTGTILGTGTLDTFPYPTIPFEQTATRLWHPVYFQADGEFVQFNLSMNDAQMRNPNIALCDFVLHAMIIYAIPTSSRLQ
jgi:hypothetical protein